MPTKRDFFRLAAGGVAVAGLAGLGDAAAAQDRIYGDIAGYPVGTCFFNYRIARGADQSAYVDAILDACVRTGVANVEMNSGNLEPATDLPYTGLWRLWDEPLSQRGPWSDKSPQELNAQREMLRAWRLQPSTVNYFAEVGQRFRRAGLNPFSYVMTFYTDMTEPEIDAVFQHARAMGVKAFSTNQTKVEMTPKLIGPADRYGVDLAWHNHPQVHNPNEIGSVQSVLRVLSASPRCKFNFDIGQAVAASVDPQDFMRQVPLDRITHFHFKDRMWDGGPSRPWGKGNTPIREIIMRVKEQRLKIPFFAEVDYPKADGSDGVAETRACMDFIRRTLTA